MMKPGLRQQVWGRRIGADLREISEVVGEIGIIW